VCGFATGAIAKRFTNFCSLVVEGGGDGGEKKYPKNMNSVDASKDSKCYSAVNFGFGQASAKSKGGDKSIGIDCIQSFEEDVEEETLATEDDNKNKKQKKTTDNNNINNKKKKDQSSDKNNASQKRRRILVAKTADSEVSVVDFSNGFEQKTKIETTFRVENATSNVPAPTSKTNGKRTVSFGLSHDGTFLACGNGTRDGIVYVYDLNIGDEKCSGDGLGDAQKSSATLAAKLLPHERHSGTMLDVIRSCAIAKDCRHVLGTTDANDGTNRAGIVFRYEIIPEQPKEYEPPMKTVVAVGEGEVVAANAATAVDKENA
jgi:hypothetical protein